MICLQDANIPINVELANIIMNLFYDSSVHMKHLISCYSTLELTHQKITSIHVYCHSNMQTYE